MTMTAFDRAVPPRGLAPARRLPLPGSRGVSHDPRWPAIAAALAALRARRRCAVRVVDADCGAGSLLIHALHHARALGFTAIEGRGIDGSPALIARARAAALRTSDRAIGVLFEVADVGLALAEEADCPADLLVWHGSRADDRGGDIPALLRRAGEPVIGDDAAAHAVTP